MASWMIHLRIADLLLDRFPDLDMTAFVMGNIAPDSGVPNADWSAYSPPKNISHYKTEQDGKSFYDGDRFLREYLSPGQIAGYSRRQYSFYLGYYVHLLTDREWSREILKPAFEKHKGAWNEEKTALVWKMKRDWYDLDFRFLEEHPDFRAFAVYENAAGFRNEYMEMFPPEAFDQRREYICHFYRGPHGELNREYPWLNPEQADQFTAKTAEKITETVEADTEIDLREILRREKLLSACRERTAESLHCRNNRDETLPFYELALERNLEDLPAIPLPPGIHLENYVPGDEEAWIAIEKSAEEFKNDGEGREAWKRYYEGHEKELESRMFFAVDDKGEKLATATAYYDIRTGDDGKNGMLHWVAVRKEAQGKGLSKPLILCTLRRMKELGYSRAVIPTQTTTWLACRVYLDLGFRPVPRNAERSREGWRIIRWLTAHPALEGFGETAEEEMKSQE